METKRGAATDAALLLAQNGVSDELADHRDALGEAAAKIDEKMRRLTNEREAIRRLVGEVEMFRQGKSGATLAGVLSGIGKVQEVRTKEFNYRLLPVQELSKMLEELRRAVAGREKINKADA